MGVDFNDGFAELLQHVGHDIAIATYSHEGFLANVAIECETCSEVLVDFDNPEMNPDTGETTPKVTHSIFGSWCENCGADMNTTSCACPGIAENPHPSWLMGMSKERKAEVNAALEQLANARKPKMT